jgi:DNA-binding NarL/FixJ family response regulator
VRVFLVDDHPVVRRGVRIMLEAEDDIEVVGDAGTVEQALLRVRIAQPHVVIIDVNLPDGSGIEVCRHIRSATPETACIMLTSSDDDTAMAASILAGACGYVIKDVSTFTLVDDIRRARAGECVLDPVCTQRVFELIRRHPSAGPPAVALTGRERSVLDLIVAGRTNRQIGQELFLAEATVKHYVTNVLSKLGMERRSQAAAYAVRLSALQPPGGAIAGC